MSTGFIVGRAIVYILRLSDFGIIFNASCDRDPLTSSRPLYPDLRENYHYFNYRVYNHKLFTIIITL